MDAITCSKRLSTCSKRLSTPSKRLSTSPPEIFEIVFQAINPFLHVVETCLEIPGGWDDVGHENINGSFVQSQAFFLFFRHADNSFSYTTHALASNNRLYNSTFFQEYGDKIRLSIPSWLFQQFLFWNSFSFEFKKLEIRISKFVLRISSSLCFVDLMVKIRIGGKGLYDLTHLRLFAILSYSIRGILHDKSKVVYTLLMLYFGSEI